MAGRGHWTLPHSHRWRDVLFVNGFAFPDRGQKVFKCLGEGVNVGLGGAWSWVQGAVVRTWLPSCLPTHLKPPVVAPHLGTVSGLPSAFNRGLVEGQPLLQGGLQPWAGRCGLWLREGQVHGLGGDPSLRSTLTASWVEYLLDTRYVAPYNPKGAEIIAHLPGWRTGDQRHPTTCARFRG